MNWRNFVPCLRTRLRDQIHRSSLSKKCFCFCWLILSLKIGIWRIERGLEGMRLGNCEVELVICKIWSKHDYFHWNLIKKMKKENSMGFWSQGLFWKWFEWSLFKFFEKWFFLSIKPKHSSKHTILDTHLNMHILAISKVMCVYVSVLVSVYIIRVHCPLHHTLITCYGLTRI